MTDPQCCNCRHFTDDPRGPARCKAFPNGIPGDIFLNLVDHRKPHEGDGGIRFEPIEGAEGREFGPEPDVLRGRGDG